MVPCPADTAPAFQILPLIPPPGKLIFPPAASHDFAAPHQKKKENPKPTPKRGRGGAHLPSGPRAQQPDMRTLAYAGGLLMAGHLPGGIWGGILARRLWDEPCGERPRVAGGAPTPEMGGDTTGGVLLGAAGRSARIRG